MSLSSSSTGTPGPLVAAPCRCFLRLLVFSVAHGRKLGYTGGCTPKIPGSVQCRYWTEPSPNWRQRWGSLHGERGVFIFLDGAGEQDHSHGSLHPAPFILKISPSAGSPGQVLTGGPAMASAPASLGCCHICSGWRGSSVHKLPLMERRDALLWRQLQLRPLPPPAPAPAPPQAVRTCRPAEGSPTPFPRGGPPSSLLSHLRKGLWIHECPEQVTVT